MNGRNQEVKAQAPIGQPGEVAEGATDGGGVVVRAIPNPDDDDSSEDVEGDEGAENCEEICGQQPGGFEMVSRVEGGIDAEEGGWGDAAHLGICLRDVGIETGTAAVGL